MIREHRILAAVFITSLALAGASAFQQQTCTFNGTTIANQFSNNSVTIATDDCVYYQGSGAVDLEITQSVQPITGANLSVTFDFPDHINATLHKTVEGTPLPIRNSSLDWNQGETKNATVTYNITADSSAKFNVTTNLTTSMIQSVETMDPVIGGGNHTVHVNTVDGQGDNVANASTYLTNSSGTTVSTGTTNATGDIRFTNVSAGDYTVNTSKNGDTDGATVAVTEDRVVNMTVTQGDSPGGNDSSSNTTNVNSDIYFSFNTSTRTNYSVPLEFKGHAVPIVNGTGGVNYTVVNRTGAVVQAFNYTTTNKFNTSTLAEGRYYINDTSSTNATGIIDVVRNDSDYIGRVRDENGMQAVNVTIHHWRNASQLAEATATTWAGSPNESLYRINHTLDSFGQNKQIWFGFTGSNYAFTYTALDATASTVHDYNLTGQHGHSLSGTVRNATRQNDGTVLQNDASGVTIQLRRVTTPFTPARLPHMTQPPFVTTTTNSTGGYTVDALPGGTYNARVVTPGYAARGSQPFGEFTVPSTTFHELSIMDATGNLTGTVNASSSATLGLMAQPRRDGSTTSTFLKADVTTGKYTFSELLTGNYTMSLYKFNVGQGTFDIRSTSEIASINEGKETNVDFSFPQLVNLSGHVTTPGENVTDGTVRAQSRDEFKFAKIQDDGSYTVQVSNSTEYAVTAIPRGAFSNYRRNTTNITTNGTTMLNLSVTTGATINGHVLDANGNGVSNVQVNIYGDTVRKFDATDNTGKYSVTGLEKGTNYTVQVEPGPSYASQYETITVSTDNTTKNFTLGSNDASLTGQVTNSSGGAVEAQVELYQRRGGIRSQSTNGSGGYAFSNMTKDRSYQLRVEPNNARYQEKSKRTFLSGDTTLNFTLATPTTVTGYVLHENGSAVSRASVYLENETSRTDAWTRTNTDGKYTVQVEKGGYRFHARKHSLPTTTATHASNESPINLTLTTGTGVSGHILDSNGATNLSGFISIYNTSARSYSYTRVANGEYNVSGLKNTSHNVWLSLYNETYDAVSASVNDTALGNTRNFTVSTNNGKKLDVTVQDTSSDNVTNVTVATPETEKSTGSDNQVSFGKQSVGDVIIQARKQGYKSTRKTITVSEPNNVDSSTVKNVTVTLEQITPLAANVTLTKDGNETQSASVVFVSNASDSAQSGSAVTDSAGSATIDGLANGGYLVTVTTGPSSVYTNTTTIQQGSTGTLGYKQGYNLSYEVSLE